MRALETLVVHSFFNPYLLVWNVFDSETAMHCFSDASIWIEIWLHFRLREVRSPVVSSRRVGRALHI